MNKRRFLQALLASGSVLLIARQALRPGGGVPAPAVEPALPPEPLRPAIGSAPLRAEQLPPMPEPDLVVERELAPGFTHRERTPDVSGLEESELDRYLQKIRNFDADFLTDIYLAPERHALLESTLARLERSQAFVGHGNFNLVGFDELLYFARNYQEIGAFTRDELDFMEEIFGFDATAYGFFGDKVTRELTSRIPHREVEKIEGSGHYLFKGESLKLYGRLHADVGDQLLLTSGVRNVVKQMHLFLAKVQQSQGNLSKASRSLAPPGYSYHGIGDFDVGKIGLGERNFTTHFSATEEYARMRTLGYVDIRYTDTNFYGVRYEPWHIKLL